MPFSGDTFTKLYNWLTDPQRNEKIFNSRLDDEFGGIATGLTTVSTDLTALDGRVDALEALPACFSVHKDGTDQTGVADSTFTLVTWPAEVYDVGGHFASNAWTPPAGKVSLKAACYTYGTTTVGNSLAVSIYKNGSSFKEAVGGANALGGAAPAIACEDIANGTDSYSVYTFIDLDSGTGTVHGAAPNTFFMGHWISA
jgi:hypothetical protein